MSEKKMSWHLIISRDRFRIIKWNMLQLNEQMNLLSWYSFFHFVEVHSMCSGCSRRKQTIVETYTLISESYIFNLRVKCFYSNDSFIIVCSDLVLLCFFFLSISDLNRNVFIKHYCEVITNTVRVNRIEETLCRRAVTLPIHRTP